MKKVVCYGIVFAVALMTAEMATAFNPLQKIAMKVQKTDIEWTEQLSAAFGDTMRGDFINMKAFLDALVAKFKAISQEIKTVNKKYEVMSLEDVKQLDELMKNLQKMSDLMEAFRSYKKDMVDKIYANGVLVDNTGGNFGAIIESIYSARKVAKGAAASIHETKTAAPVVPGGTTASQESVAFKWDASKMRDSSVLKAFKDIIKAEEALEKAKLNLSTAQRKSIDNIGALENILQQFINKTEDLLAGISTESTRTEKRATEPFTSAQSNYAPIIKMKDICKLFTHIRKTIEEKNNSGKEESADSSLDFED
ncbi:MAG: hypothetical protein LBJ71_03575 [Holosporaceae bacterium]|jgi:t-SNARE complex subunit (syntaxin)|nr:hypothetical protein [Holosporaceae bacterium]